MALLTGSLFTMVDLKRRGQISRIKNPLTAIACKHAKNANCFFTVFCEMN